ncbi:MAG: hypothetical protein V3T05_09335, partial [Myxococcota bacterium]
MRNRVLATLIVAAVALTLAACGTTRINAHPAPTSAGGVTFTLFDIKAKKDLVYLFVRAENLSGQHAQVYTGLIGAVGPDGQTRYAVNGTMVYIGPRSTKKIKVMIKGGPQWGELPGFYVRLDGVCVGSSPVGLQPITINAPSGGAGQPPSSGFSCPGGAVASSGTIHIKTPVGSVTLGSGASSPPPSSGGVQRYTGVRQKIKQEGLKCAAMPLAAPGIAEEIAFIMDEVLLTELQRAGFEAIGPDDINALVGFERVKDAVGCDDATCIAEIGNAL